MTPAHDLILVTRPREDAEELVNKLEKMGKQAVIESVLEIVPTPHATDGISSLIGGNIDIIVATSRHALPALAECAKARTLPLMVVGETTAARAAELGFLHIVQGGGTVEALAETLKARLSDSAGVLLYARGKDVSADLQALLLNSWLVVKEVVVYEAVASTSLSPETESLFREGRIGVVAVYSRRSLSTLEALIRQHGLESYAQSTALVCYSAAIASFATHSLWRDVIAAEEDMLEMLVREADAYYHAPI